MPDAGFDEANAGSQEDAVGVLGMLDVIKSDFIRTQAETKKAEKQAEAEHLEFKTTTNSSIAEKTSAETSKEAVLGETEAAIGSDTEAMKTTQDVLDSVIKQMIQIDKACNAPEMSHEERVAAREEEIEALRSALQSLKDATPGAL
jgi:hypothetical protein